MSASVKVGQFSGGAALAPGASSDDLAKVLRSMIDDMNTLRTAYNVLAAKLNADAGVTDVNYATVAALATTKA
jgi:hypothetical protein